MKVLEKHSYWRIESTYVKYLFRAKYENGTWIWVYYGHTEEIIFNLPDHAHTHITLYGDTPLSTDEMAAYDMVQDGVFAEDPVVFPGLFCVEE